MNRILETCDAKYILLSRIGHGGTSQVYKGYSINDKDTPHKLYAIKIFKQRQKKCFEKETSINNILPPKNKQNSFLTLFAYGIGYMYKEPKTQNHNNQPTEICPNIKKTKIFYKIEELCENGELFDYIYKLKQGFTEEISAKIFAKILHAVKILHEKNIVHCDIKPENILLGNDFEPKLIDFGYSKYINKENNNNNNTNNTINNIVYGNEGSESYSSPEIRRNFMSGYDGVKSDIFSLGVLLFVITVGRFPFISCEYSDEKYGLIMDKKYEEYWANYNKYNLTKEFKDLINHLICYEPKDRLSIDEIFNHSWITMHVNKSENKDNNCCADDENVLNELKKRRDYILKKSN